jgi:hypothetical protein
MKIPNIQSNRYKRNLWRLVFATIIALAVGCWWYLLDTGYCVSKMRYLSDRELIESALRYEAAGGQMMVDDSEESIRDFLQKNPRCCSVDRHPFTRNPVLDVLTGFNISHVELNYQRQGTPEEIKKRGKFYKQFISVDACGPALRAAYGTDTSTLENAF